MKKKLTLSNVTLLAATSVDIEQTNFNLKISSEFIEFAEIKFLSSFPHKKKISGVEYIQIPIMKIDDYNRLIIKDLHNYFDTSHCLIIQADSFIVNFEN